MRAWNNSIRRGLAILSVNSGDCSGIGLDADRERRHPRSQDNGRRHAPHRASELGRTRCPTATECSSANTLYLAGQIGIDPQTGQPPEDIEKEIRLMLDGMKTTLKEAGMTMDDLVSVQVFCPDLSLYEKFNEIYRTYFTKNFPARAFIGSGPLLRGGRFEVQGIAVRR